MLSASFQHLSEAETRNWKRAATPTTVLFMLEAGKMHLLAGIYLWRVTHAFSEPVRALAAANHVTN